MAYNLLKTVQSIVTGVFAVFAWQTYTPAPKKAPDEKTPIEVYTTPHSHQYSSSSFLLLLKPFSM